MKIIFNETNKKNKKVINALRDNVNNNKIKELKLRGIELPDGFDKRIKVIKSLYKNKESEKIEKIGQKIIDEYNDSVKDLIKDLNEVWSPELINILNRVLKK